MPGLKSLTKKSTLSEEYIVESDSEEETTHTKPPAKKPASVPSKLSTRPLSLSNSTSIARIPPAPLQKRKYESPIVSSTGSDASSAETGSDGHNSTPNSQVKKPEKQRKDIEISRDSDSDDESASDEATSEDGPSEEATDGSRSIPSNPKVPYKAPPGFESAIIAPTSVRYLHKFFSQEYLRGKQIWHITAPANVPLSSIKEVPIQKVAEGGSILSYEGGDYGLVTEDDVDYGGKVLLVPSAEDNDYRPTREHIERTLHLQQIVKLPASSYQDGVPANGATNISKSHIKAVRQQPEGLRMRYRPFGDESSSEDIEESPQFKLPPKTSAARPPQGKKLLALGREPSPTKAQAKDMEIHGTTQPTSVVSKLSKLAQESCSKKISEHEGRESDSARKPSKDSRSKETPEERAQRRAERKRRKQTKGEDFNHSIDQLEEPSTSREHDGKENNVKGVVETRQKSPEIEKPKAKRKKRKAEAPEDA
ncbi:MAG: hypothetical protein Q9182_003382 [Xanthomendoza sp. 2 TL-2023]